MSIFLRDFLAGHPLNKKVVAWANQDAIVFPVLAAPDAGNDPMHQEPRLVHAEAIPECPRTFLAVGDDTLPGLLI